MEPIINDEEVEIEEKISDIMSAEATLYGVIGTNNVKIESFRLFLMFCACIKMLGLPGKIGGIIQFICGFAAPAFFILSGMLVLTGPNDRLGRIKRTIKRSAIAFIGLLVFYAAINLLSYRFLGANVFPLLKSKRLWFNFVVLNVWPFDIGQVIWYVQSILYAYITVYFLGKLNLLRFDWIISSVLLIFNIISGELNGILNLKLFGYQFFPPNFFNRALPFILLGSFLARNVSVWAFLHPVFYLIGTIFGMGLTVCEPVLLSYFGVPGYYSHVVGMGITAVSLCLLLFHNIIKSDADIDDAMEDFEFPLSRRCTNFIYYLFQPLAVLLGFAVVKFKAELFLDISDYLGLITFAVLLFMAFIPYCLKKLTTKGQHAKTAPDNNGFPV